MGIKATPEVKFAMIREAVSSILYPIKWTLGSVKWTGTSPIYGRP